LNSFGSGQATATNPDPGVAATLPAIGAGLLPGLLPVPLPVPIPSVQYPGTVSVQSGQAPVERGSGPYRLSASITQADDLQIADARSVIGGRTSVDPADPTGGFAQDVSSQVFAAADGRVVATANSIVDGLNINGILTIGRVNATAVAQRSPDGTLTRTSTLYIGEISVAGVRAAYENGQFVAATTGSPFPQGDIENLVRMASNGLFQLKIQPALETKNGVVAPTLQLIQTLPPPKECVSVPVPGVPVFGGITYEFGRADASTNYSLVPGSVTAGAVPGVNGAAPTGVDAASGVDLAGAGLGTLPSTAGGIPTATLTPASAGGDLAKVAATLELRNVYLVLAAAAVIAFLGAMVLRLLGVRNRWAS
jgi:hypothetical protein